MNNFIKKYTLCMNFTLALILFVVFYTQYYVHLFFNDTAKFSEIFFGSILGSILNILTIFFIFIVNVDNFSNPFLPHIIVLMFLDILSITIFFVIIKKYITVREVNFLSTVLFFICTLYWLFIGTMTMGFIIHNYPS